MLRRKPVFQAHLHPAGFTNTSIGKRKNFPAPPHSTCGFLLLARIAISRFVMPFQNPGLVAAVLPGGLDRRRADFANHHFSAVPIGFRAVVGFETAMLQTEHLLATVAGEGEEIELVAIGVLAVAAEIGESLCSSAGGHGDLFVGRFWNWK